jgi:hypothetical protein
VADRVFEDRVGLWIINPANLGARLPAIRSFGGGLIRDVFLPRSAELGDLTRVRDAGLYAHLYAATDGLDAAAYAARTLADVGRLRPGAVELNFELSSDPPWPTYMRETVTRIRTFRPNLRLRLNTPPWKGFAFPVDRLIADPHLYACEQNYLGNMDELLSAEDVAGDLRAWGVPAAKVTVCYAAACRVLGSSSRLRTLPDLSRIHRGVIFQDDLMAEAGLL